MREYLKIGMFFSLFAVCTAGFVVASTLGVIHYRDMQGKGGYDTSDPFLAINIIEPDKETVQEEEIPAVAEGEAAEPQESIAEVPSVTEGDRDLWYQSYCIKKGDMIGFIAESFGITQDTIISVNHIGNSRLIQPGDYLKIASMPGILYTVKEGGETIASITEKYKVDAQKCSLANNTPLEEELSAGRSIFVPDAKMDWATVQEINGDLFTRPLRVNYYISSRFGWRTNPFNSAKRTYHGGVDMACPKGTNIYAALSGKVITAGWSDIYGNYVVVSHHSGYKTLYGHMSKISVKAGQSVTTATKLGEVGSTGMSTGNHLHFAVYKNNKGINPLSLLN